MLRVSSYVHHFLLKHLDAQACIVDLTLGRGSDTLFCAQHFKQVLSFDIQEEAHLIAKEKCLAYSNINFILDDHQHLAKYVDEPIDAALFNSGFLPSGKSMLSTQTHTSLLALSAAIKLIKPQRFLCCTLYQKHDLQQEALAIQLFLSQQTNIQLMDSYTYPNDPLSPLVLIYKKII